MIWRMSVVCYFWLSETWPHSICKFIFIQRNCYHNRHKEARINIRMSFLLLSHLDYCNAVLAGLPGSTLAPFQRVLFWISSHVTVWLRLSESCTGYQSPKGSSTSCACWLTNRSLDTRQNTSQTFLHQLPNFWVDPHYVPRHVATSLCHGHVDESATKLFLSLHHEHGTSCRQN